MVSRTLILLALAFAVAANSLPYNFGAIPEQFKEFLPEEAKQFYADLTEEDKAILKEVALQHENFENEDQAFEALKAKSEKLYEKATALRKLVKDKIDGLEAEAKTFIEGTISKLKTLRPKSGEKPNLTELRKAANEIIETYKKLSEAAKDNLKSAFPKITSVVQNDKFQKLAQGLLKEQN
jgi:hypothetical protein|uniref:Fatty-acid and retinol-binding protein 1 n=1 Tax=Panagrolaimus sp. PS1159 TaxID=55785 RepID=A0AC35GRN8_9BILA